MTNLQYRAALKKLGLTVVGAAPVLGVSRRQSQYYASGETPIPEPIVRLLRCYLAHGLPAPAAPLRP